MAYWMHDHICHIRRPKLRLINSGDRISKEKEVIEILRFKNLKYDRIFQFTNCLLN